MALGLEVAAEVRDQPFATALAFAVACIAFPFAVRAARRRAAREADP